MSADERDEQAQPGPPAPNRDRRELDAVFGDLLPDTTSDEREPESPSGDREAWYRENRPPHHDR
ncbi:hypothetical protein [Amycolatopsis alkalitolerans]|uniref:Uncharacterized protein n=1 Tax=Amycolatopsis alkalitolerans TaxID=2547244 RepID=A0A5C4LYC6_9PSEU|nr:hypothetical protein [Amycolatopsis alkalitolerans]TNC23693.1 hypothetical protein FG385_20205 [Amycolatopsis alkalitolerans]